MGSIWERQGGDPLARGKGASDIHIVTRPGSWPLHGHSVLDAQMRISEKQDLSIISVKSHLARSFHFLSHLRPVLLLELTFCFYLS